MRCWCETVKRISRNVSCRCFMLPQLSTWIVGLLDTFFCSGIHQLTMPRAHARPFTIIVALCQDLVSKSYNKSLRKLPADISQRRNPAANLSAARQHVSHFKTMTTTSCRSHPTTEKGVCANHIGPSIWSKVTQVILLLDWQRL